MTPPKTTTPKAGLSLADLTPEAREELLAQARQGGTAVDPDTVAKAALRDDQLKELLRSRDHMDGCPVDTTGQGRVESYASRRPAKPDEAIPAKDVTVIRCIECGGSRVIEKSYEEVVAEIEEVIAA